MFNEKLRFLRLGENLSQVEFSKIMGVSQSSIAGWENGTREPNIETLIKIAQHFNVSVDYLIGNSFMSESQKQFNSLSAIEKSLLDVLKELSPQNQIQILEYARYCATRSNIQIKINTVANRNGKK